MLEKKSEMDTCFFFFIFFLFFAEFSAKFAEFNRPKSAGLYTYRLEISTGGGRCLARWAAAPRASPKSSASGEKEWLVRVAQAACGGRNFSTKKIAIGGFFHVHRVAFSEKRFIFREKRFYFSAFSRGKIRDSALELELELELEQKIIRMNKHIQSYKHVQT